MASDSPKNRVSYCFLFSDFFLGVVSSVVAVVVSVCVVVIEMHNVATEGEHTAVILILRLQSVRDLMEIPKDHWWKWPIDRW